MGTTFDDAGLRALQARLSGPVVGPGDARDARWDDARRAYNLTIDQ